MARTVELELRPESRESTVGTGGSGGEIVFFPENSPYAHLKHLGLGPANDIGAL